VLAASSALDANLRTLHPKAARAISPRLAQDIADHAAQTGAQELELAIVALELLRVGIASGHDRGPLGNPDDVGPFRTRGSDPAKLMSYCGLA